MENLNIRSAAAMRQLIEIADEAAKIIAAQQDRILELEELSNNVHNMPEKLTPEEVADYLRCSKTKIYEMCRTGEIKAIRNGKKLWLIAREDLEAYSRTYRSPLKKKAYQVAG